MPSLNRGLVVCLIVVPPIIASFEMIPAAFSWFCRLGDGARFWAPVPRFHNVSEFMNSNISHPNSYKGCKAWDALHTIRMGE